MWPLFRVNIISEITVIENWNNTESDGYVSALAVLSSFYFPLKSSISFMRFFNGNSLIVAWRFRIQDSRFKKKSMKMHFKKKSTRFLKIKACVHNSPIIDLLFHTKISTVLRRGFSQKFRKSALLHLLYVWNQKLNTK